jgi:cytochrome c oxidase subunit 2
MLLRVIVEPRADFEQWVAGQRSLARTSDSIPRGRRVFETTACVNCHTVSGTNAHGTFGPDLTHLMSRGTIAAGAAPLTQDTLRRWIRSPDSVKPGSKMPAMQLTPDELDAVTAYLLTLE